MKLELLKVTALAALLAAGSIPAAAQSNPPTGTGECAPGTSGTIVPNADGTTSCVQSNSGEQNPGATQDDDDGGNGGTGGGAGGTTQ